MKAKHRIKSLALATALLMLASLGGSSGIAQTTNDGPPRMDLRWPGHSTQEGKRGSYCWTDGDGSGICVDMIGGFPKAMWVKSGARLKIRIHYAEKPDDFSVGAWRRVDENGYGKGRAQQIDVRLKPVTKNGETRAWDAIFRLGGDRHYYIDAFGRWAPGDASWSFHVRTVKTG